MVIITSVAFDNTTSEVMDWLQYANCPVTRLNCDKLTLQSFQAILPISSKFQSIVSSVWFRKEGTSYFSGDLSLPEDNVRHAALELNSLKAALTSIQDCYTLGKVDCNFNKVSVLKAMMKFGLKIPPTLITGRRCELLEFVKEHRGVIVKPISDGMAFTIGGKRHKIYTERIDGLIDELDDFFFPGLFQKYIPKQFEIRSLYLEGNVHSMAIFSQRNEKTQVDQRYPDRANPLRRVPFKLPRLIEEKMKALMMEMRLSIGVFDIIKSYADYIFLELNPSGQFGDISKSCNYFLERRVANLLTRAK